MTIHELQRERRIYADKIRPIAGGLLLSGNRVSVRLPMRPERYLRHGWQSWSLSSWTALAQPLPTPRPAVLHPVHTDPRYAELPHPHGAFYGAVEGLDGAVMFLGALGISSRVELVGELLQGRYEMVSTETISQDEWFFAIGEEPQILARYAQLLGERLGRGRIEKAPRVWCSWYSLFTRITESDLIDILRDLQDLPFDVFQVDDGWQRGIGDWEANEKFPSGMAALAQTIRAEARTPGLWLAPLLVVPSSTLFRDHPDWILRDEKGIPISAGVNWREPLYALDTSRPEVLDWLRALMHKVRSWGFDYVKLDFLYAGALPGVRKHLMPREAAYRQGLRALREALGDAYLLTCGAPILPSIGLCDGMRVGPDVAAIWESVRDRDYLGNFATPGVRNALRTSLHRLWLRALVHTDPDVAYFSARSNRLTAEQRRLLQDLAQVAGFKATSELPKDLNLREREALRAFLLAAPRIEPVFRTAFRIDDRIVDFAHAAQLPPPPGRLVSLIGRAIDEVISLPGAMALFQRLTDSP